MPPYEKPKTAYDFITKPPTPEKPAAPLKGRLPLIAGGGIALVILLLIVMSLLNNGPSNKDTLLKVTQQQTEIVRVANLGTKDAAQATRNIAYNTSLSVGSDKTKLLQALAANDLKFSDKDMAAGANGRTTQQFTAARAASNFDEMFLKTLDSELAAYQVTVNEAYKHTSGPKLKKSLENSYKHSKTLRTQIKAAQ